MATKCYLKNPGVKRLMRESQELANPTEDYYACPLEDNLFEWHFTIKGPPDSEFQEGYYHGRILLPPQYPMKPPNIILLTPNGRFEINKKICLSISGYHPETWQPSWSIRTVLLALIAFMPTKGIGTIGSLDYTREERRTLAKKSKNWECSICGKIADKLMEAERTESPVLTKEESSMLQNIAFKAEEEANRKEGSTEDGGAETVQNVTIENLKESTHGPLNSSDENLRQRNVPNINSSSVAAIFSDVQNDDAYIEGIRANIENRKWDRFWKIIVYFILFLIAIILIRRFFFINANY